MNSKRTGIIIGVIVLLLILSAVSFKVIPLFLSGIRPNDKGSSITKNGTGRDITPKEQRSTLTKLLGTGKSSECTFTTNTESVNMSGKIYVTTGKMRGNFESTLAAGQKVTSNMIQDGDWVYSWTSESQQGIKMKINTMMESSKSSESNTNTNNNAYKNFDPNLEMNYDCKSWIVNNSMFTPPSNVTFMEINLPTTTPDLGETSQNCALCDTQGLDDAAKATCKKTFNCN